MVSERKAPLLELLASLDEALMNITRFVVRLAPVGIFAIAANAAGTLDLTAFDKLQVYVWSYLVLWALLFFLLLPGLVVAFTPVRYSGVLCGIPHSLHYRVRDRQRAGGAADDDRGDSRTAGTGTGPGTRKPTPRWM